MSNWRLGKNLGSFRNLIGNIFSERTKFARNTSGYRRSQVLCQYFSLSEKNYASAWRRVWAADFALFFTFWDNFLVNTWWKKRVKKKNVEQNNNFSYHILKNDSSSRNICHTHDARASYQAWLSRHDKFSKRPEKPDWMLFIENDDRNRRFFISAMPVWWWRVKAERFGTNRLLEIGFDFSLNYFQQYFDILQKFSMQTFAVAPCVCVSSKKM